MKHVLVLATLVSMSFSAIAYAQTLPLTSKNLVQHMVTTIGPAADLLEAAVNKKATSAEVCTAVMMTTQAVWQARNQASTFQVGAESEAVLNEWLNQMRDLQDLCAVAKPDLKTIAAKVPSSNEFGTRLYDSAK